MFIVILLAALSCKTSTTRAQERQRAGKVMRPTTATNKSHEVDVYVIIIISSSYT